MIKDLQVSLRTFRKRPAFAVAIVGILGLGIGANLAVFDLAWRLVYSPLPYLDAERLVRVWGESRDGRTTRLAFSIPRFELFRDGQRSLSAVAADVATAFTLTGIGDPVQINGLRVTANYFDVLGISPVLGRTFRDDEEQVGGVAVVTSDFWRTRLAAAGDVLGRALTLDGTTYTIAGVVPQPPSADAFRAEVYVTRPFEVGLPREVLQRGVSFLRFSGRMSASATVEEVRNDMVLLGEGYRRQYAGNADADWSARVVPLREDLSSTVRPAIATLLGAVALVLLLACSNAANLLTAHFLGRNRELAVRASLGAGRLQLIRLCVTETTLLSVAGAILGVLLALQIDALVPRFGATLPLDARGTVPWTLLIAGSSLALLVGIATGLHPGIQSARLQAVDTLRAARGSTPGRQRFQQALVGIQVAVSVVLLFAAVLLTESFGRVSRQEPGFDTAHVLTASIALPPGRYPTPLAQNVFYERLRERLLESPGVESAALIAGLPLSGALSRAPYARSDAAMPLNQRPLGPTRSVTPGYFDTMRVALRAGRDFTPDDGSDSRPVVILSQSTAARLFPNEDPIGRVILTGSQNGGIPAEVVGVVGDVRSLTLTQNTDIELYRPFAQRGQPFAQIVVKTHVPPASFPATLRAVVQSLDPELPLTQVATAEQVVGNSLGQRRLLMGLLGTFAALAFALSAAGIYAAVAFAVGRRTTEIGVRMALGARPADVLLLVAAQGMRPVFAGALVGVVALPVVANRLAQQLYEIAPLDPMRMAVVVGLILGVAGVASVTPARRAARLAPTVALRGE